MDYETLILETRAQKLLDLIERNGGKCSLTFLFRHYKEKDNREILFHCLDYLKKEDKIKATVGIESCYYVKFRQDGYRNEPTLFYSIVER